jgi:hypothetical protein
MYGKVREERFDLRFGREEVVARPHAVETDKANDPLHIGALGVNGVVVETKHPSDFVEEFGWLTSCCVRHIRSPS